MECKITQISSFASDILAHASCGTVHSVYRKTVNILADGQLIAIQAADSPLSPISLITELDETAMQELALKPGLPLIISNSFFRINFHTFYYSSARVFSPALTDVLDKQGQRKLAAAVKSALLASRTGGFDTVFRAYWEKDSALPSLILEGARRYMSDAHHSVLSGDMQNAASLLARLIGLGTGLTPSGDDFLCGVFAGLTLSGKSETAFAGYLRDAVKQRLGDTNDISRAFLCCALENRYSLAVKSLARVPSPAEITSAFSAIGHSSGFDTLCGVCFSLHILE